MLDMEEKEIIEELDKLIRHATRLKAAIAAEAPVMPPEAIEKLRLGLCLVCGKKIRPDQKQVRGDHESCYKQVMREIEAGIRTMDEAISDGLIAQKQTSGRKKSAPLQPAPLRKKAKQEVDRVKAKIKKDSGGST